jgi:hypothetical protein
VTRAISPPGGHWLYQHITDLGGGALPAGTVGATSRNGPVEMGRLARPIKCRAHDWDYEGSDFQVKDGERSACCLVDLNGNSKGRPAATTGVVCEIFVF